MKKIGIIIRENNDKLTIKKEVSDLIIRNGAIPIGIIPPSLNDEVCNFEELKKIIDICDGFILQGGTSPTKYDIEIVKYIYEKDIPTLGICLGMQTMSLAFNGLIDYIGNNEHSSSLNYVHNITIDPNSKLFSIINSNNIMVNSRHVERISKTDLDIVAISNNIIEAVEDKNKNFFIGVQWHPETIYYDIYQKKLIGAFFKILN